MPFALILIGLLLIVAGARKKYGELKDLLVSDFTGEGNFFYWVIAIGVVGALGYVQGFEKFSRYFIVLLLLGMLLAAQRGSTGGFFTKFSEALTSLQPSKAEEGESGGSGSKTPNSIEQKFQGGPILPGFGGSSGSSFIDTFRGYLPSL